MRRFLRKYESFEDPDLQREFLECQGLNLQYVRHIRRLVQRDNARRAAAWKANSNSKNTATPDVGDVQPTCLVSYRKRALPNNARNLVGSPARPGDKARRRPSRRSSVTITVVLPDGGNTVTTVTFPHGGTVQVDIDRW